MLAAPVARAEVVVVVGRFGSGMVTRLPGVSFTGRAAGSFLSHILDLHQERKREQLATPASYGAEPVPKMNNAPKGGRFPIGPGRKRRAIRSRSKKMARTLT